MKRFVSRTEIGKAKQAYGPMAPNFIKLWAISKKVWALAVMGWARSSRKEILVFLVREDVTFDSVYHTASCS